METFKATDPRVDTYIEQAPDFAQPILRRLRKLVHEAIPECHESTKWNLAEFDYKGPFCSMAAFKTHCTFGFAKMQLLEDADGVLKAGSGNPSPNLARITSEADLPADEAIISLIRQAQQLNDDGTRLPMLEAETAGTPVPEDLTVALAQHILARNQWEQFNPDQQEDYLVWLAETEAQDARIRRIETILEWISEGKERSWNEQE